MVVTMRMAVGSVSDNRMLDEVDDSISQRNDTDLNTTQVQQHNDSPTQSNPKEKVKKLFTHRFQLQHTHTHSFCQYLGKISDHFN